MKEGNNIRKTWHVEGMNCASCAAGVESALKKSPGINFASVNLASNTALVEYDPGITDPAQLKQAVQVAGFDLLIDDDYGRDQFEQTQAASYRKLKKNTLLSIAFSLPVAVIAMFLPDLPYGRWIMWLLTTPVLMVFGNRFIVNAWRQARHGKASMDTLVAMSTSVAYLFSLLNTLYPEYLTGKGLEAHVYYEATAVIISFILLGRWLEDRAKSGTGAAIRQLMGMQPSRLSRVTEDGSIVSIPVRDVQPGDLILIRPGERLPVDGTVASGSSFVDESAITGEAIPAEKTTGSRVFAGTLNQKGSFRFIAEQVGEHTMLARIIQLVQEAQGSKAPVQRLVDKIAGVFVPAVMGIALLSMGIWLLAGGQQAITHGLLAMVTVLVIACPCALGLATPTAIMAGVGKAAEKGILIRNAESLQKIRRIDTVILDKTGTITEGHPSVNSIRWAGDYADRTFAERVLLGAETLSEHPLATALVQYLRQRDVVPYEPENFESHTGQGITATAGVRKYFIGNRKLLEEQGISIPDELKEGVEEQAGVAWSHVFLAVGQEVVAVISIGDKIKASSIEAIRKLKNSGIKVIMLTGDNEATANAVARATGISRYKANVTPAGKSQYVTELQEEGRLVAMVGDGINDAAALASADVGIAMGKGADIAMEAAGMTIIHSDLIHISDAINISARTVKTIRQNLFWAFIYNLAGIPLAAGLLYPVNGFLLDPMIAGAAMALSSVSVVSNSLRLKYIK